jgi:hypothetical protein
MRQNVHRSDPRGTRVIRWIRGHRSGWLHVLGPRIGQMRQNVHRSDPRGTRVIRWIRGHRSGWLHVLGPRIGQMRQNVHRSDPCGTRVIRGIRGHKSGWLHLLSICFWSRIIPRREVAACLELGWCRSGNCRRPH